ncbi:RNA-binding S4 domain-containing protein [bacterium]|nr:RNA-binding S4 domain-containing protein [bacterium]
MRLDLFLKASRLVKRRSLAQDFCRRGWIEVNGRKGKPGKDVLAGDRITLHLGSRIRVVKIIEIPKGNVPAWDANRLYEILSDQQENIPSSSSIEKGDKKYG